MYQEYFNTCLINDQSLKFLQTPVRSNSDPLKQTLQKTPQKRSSSPVENEHPKNHPVPEISPKNQNSHTHTHTKKNRERERTILKIDEHGFLIRWF